MWYGKDSMLFLFRIVVTSRVQWHPYFFLRFDWVFFGGLIRSCWILFILLFSLLFEFFHSEPSLKLNNWKYIRMPLHPCCRHNSKKEEHWIFPILHLSVRVTTPLRYISSELVFFHLQQYLSLKDVVCFCVPWSEFFH